ncbi:MAG: CPBP family intramembrane metalloprotease [Planctomycetes bacterium]|nr:CPBP family intramembrane metalloprotease [Planctomycetota bacterium]
MIDLKKIRAIFVKELRDSLRDRRTVFANFVIPLLLYPVMLLLVSEATQVAIANRQHDHYRVAVVPAESLAFLSQLEAIEEELDKSDQEKARAAGKTVPLDDGFETKEETVSSPRLLFEVVPDAESALRNRKVQAVVRLPRGFTEAMADPRASKDAKDLPVEFLYDQAEQRSRDARELLERVFARYQQKIVAERLKRRGLSVDMLLPFEIVASRNIAPAEKVGGSAIGAILPLWFIMMIIAGALHPAIDLTAGEKERSTLETLISAPVRPLEVIAGKFVAVATLALSNAVLNVLSFGITFHAVGISKLPDLHVPWAVLPAALLLLLPLTLFFSALLLAVASLAASAKEAQVYCLPIFLIPTLGLMVVIIPGIEPSGSLLVMPVINTALVIKELFLGHEGLAQAYAFTFVSTCLYAVAAVGIAARVFAREEILFSSQASLRIFLDRKFFKPALAPKAGDALLLLALIFPVWFYCQLYLPTASGDVAVNFLVPFVIVFMLLPLAVTRYLKAGLASTFLWRMPSPRHLYAGILLGASSWLLAFQLTALQTHFWPMPSLSSPQLEAFKALPIWVLVGMLALAPGIFEEHLFRGFLLSSLRQDRMTGRSWGVFLSAAIFAAFHIPLFRQPVVFLIGLALGYLAWESRSIWPGVIFHFMNNALSLRYEDALLPNGIDKATGVMPSPPPLYVAAAAGVFALGLWLARAPKPAAPGPAVAQASSLPPS